MSRINRVPIGLQSFLDSQNAGDNPSELARTVIPIIDLQPFYEARNWEVLTAIASGLTTQQEINAITVPEGEIWFVKGGSALIRCTSGGGADEGVRVSMGFRQWSASDGAQDQGLCNLGEYFGDTSHNISVQHYFPEVIPFTGGSIIWFRAVGIVVSGAGTVDVRTSLHFLRMNA